jgi:hypothetical protein
MVASSYIIWLPPKLMQLASCTKPWDVGTFRANFPNKGQLVGQHGVDTAPFEAYMATAADAKPESFWKQVVMHACDPTVHDNWNNQMNI